MVLAFKRVSLDIVPMAKVKRSGKISQKRALRSFRSVTKRAKKVASAPKTAHGYQIVGITTDGIRILRAKVKPKHFTSSQIRKAISEVEKLPID